VEEKNNKGKTKEEEKKKKTEKKNKKVNFFWSLKEWWASEKKKKNPPQCFVWFSTGLGSSKTAKTASSTTGALVGAGSQQAEKLKRRPFHFPLPILYLWMRFPIQSFYVELLNSRKSKPRSFKSDFYFY
jgi:hypothetical protein